MDLSKLETEKLVKLIDNRCKSSDSLWQIIKKIGDRNTLYYDCDVYDREHRPEYFNKYAVNQHRVSINRIFTDMEAVINAVISNPPKPNLIPKRNTAESIELAQLQERYFVNKYTELNVKETIRKGLRNLYFYRLIVLKPFWNAKTNEFDVRVVNPNQVRFSKTATSEKESEFAIEEITDTLENLINKFPNYKEAILQKSGISEDQLLIQNPEVIYQEAWIKDRLIWKYKDIILGNIRNPYWDWDGLITTREEEVSLMEAETKQRKQLLEQIRETQGERKQTVNQTEAGTMSAYYFNHFDIPRKPYIFATLFNNENTPIGRTDFITQSIPLQESANRRKTQIDENAELMNGIVKIDKSVMTEAEAQKLRWQTKGIIYGKGVVNGVAREAGTALPNFIYEDMQGSLTEIDNIMAATSAFRGEREGTETKGGRLALVEQSFLRLNELVQVIDYINYELFNWFYQLAKVRYTEVHYSKEMGQQNAIQVMEFMQDDFEDGTEIKIIPGKTLPEDKQFKYQKAQEDVANGIISPIDYFKDSGDQNPVEKAQNAVLYKINPAMAVGLSPEQVMQATPTLQPQDFEQQEQPQV